MCVSLRMVVGSNEMQEEREKVGERERSFDFWLSTSIFRSTTSSAPKEHSKVIYKLISLRTGDGKQEKKGSGERVDCYLTQGKNKEVDRKTNIVHKTQERTGIRDTGEGRIETKAGEGEVEASKD